MRTTLILVFILTACGHQSPRALSHSDGTRVTFSQLQSEPLKFFHEILGWYDPDAIDPENFLSKIRLIPEPGNPLGDTSTYVNIEDALGADAEYVHGPWCLHFRPHEIDHYPVDKHGPWCWDSRALWISCNNVSNVNGGIFMCSVSCEQFFKDAAYHSALAESQGEYELDAWEYAHFVGYGEECL